MMLILFLSVVVRAFYIPYFERYILFILQLSRYSFEIPYFGRLRAHGLCLWFKLIFFMTLSIYIYVCSLLLGAAL